MTEMRETQEMAGRAEKREKIEINDIAALLKVLNGRSKEEIGEEELKNMLDEVALFIAEYDKTKKGSPSDMPAWLLSEIIENLWEAAPWDGNKHKFDFLKALSDSISKKEVVDAAPKIVALATHDPESAIFFLYQLDNRLICESTKAHNKNFLKDLYKYFSKNAAASSSIFSYLPGGESPAALERCKNAARIFLEAILNQKYSPPKMLADLLVWLGSLKQFPPDDKDLLEGIKEKVTLWPPEVKEGFRDEMREKGYEAEWQSMVGMGVLTDGKGAVPPELTASKNASLSTPVCVLSDAKDPETNETHKSDANNPGLIAHKDDAVAQTEPANSDTQKPSEKSAPNNSASWRETLRKTDECYKNLLGLLDECLKYGTANALAQREEYRQKIVELERELAKSKNGLEELEKKLQVEKKYAQDLKEKYVQNEECIDGLKEEKKDLARKLAEKEKELEGKKVEAVKLRDELASARAEMKQQNDRLTEELAERERRLPIEFRRGKKEVAREISDRLKKKYMDMDALSDNEENRLAKENMRDIFSRLAEFGITFQ